VSVEDFQGPLPEPELPPPALSSSPLDRHDRFAVNARPMLDPVEPAVEQQDEQHAASGPARSRGAGVAKGVIAFARWSENN
jgi:hypothetical protein